MFSPRPPGQLRSGKPYQPLPECAAVSHGTASNMHPSEEVETAEFMFPLIDKGNQRRYVPWTFMDMVGLAGRLPGRSAAGIRRRKSPVDAQSREKHR